MTVSKECESEILRLVQAEKWPEGTVAAELVSSAKKNEGTFDRPVHFL